jgi:acetyl-CoA synthetase
VTSTTLDALSVVWQPPAHAFASSPAGVFAARHGISDYATLSRRSVEEPEWFWAAVVADLGIPWIKPYERVLDLADGPERPHFFAGGQLNFNACAVDRWIDQGRGERRALWWEGDDGATASISYAELQTLVNRAAGAFQDSGVGPGDVIALLLPMIPEAVITVLAAARIGAIVAPMFSGFGPTPIRARLEDSRARLLVTCDAFPRRGRRVDLKSVADEAMEGLESVLRTLVVRRLDGAATMRPERDAWWHDAVAAATPVAQAVALDVEAPLLLLYTSGSTGRPKGCVHTHGGMPIKVAEESRYHLGIDDAATVLWVTDMGWVMGSYVLAGALLNGGTAALYEGTPDWPSPSRLWEVTERAEATVLGVSPTLIRALMAHGVEPLRGHDLGRLRAIGSTGEPWNLDPWLWCFENVGRGRVPIVNISGGTECGGSIVAGTTFSPTKPTSFAGPTLGVATDIVDADGNSVRGEVGELVVRRPWPGMTKGFWEGGERYLQTYWSRFPGMWQQGDFALVDGDGAWYLLGRSDDTIMVAGKRVGPAEIETVLVADPAVIEAAAVGVPDEVKGEAMICLVTLLPGADDQGTTERLADTVAAAFGKPMRPRAVFAVPALPKTRNGKILRRLVRAVYTGEQQGDISTIEDPAVLEHLPRDERAISRATTGG